MAEEAQELVVTNDAQPLVTEIEVAETLEVSEAMLAAMPASQTVSIDPATD